MLFRTSSTKDVLKLQTCRLPYCNLTHFTNITGNSLFIGDLLSCVQTVLKQYVTDSLIKSNNKYSLNE
jgi:hypothetical protein